MRIHKMEGDARSPGGAVFDGTSQNSHSLSHNSPSFPEVAMGGRRGRRSGERVKEEEEVRKREGERGEELTTIV